VVEEVIGHVKAFRKFDRHEGLADYFANGQP
jgi:hypothetical protein